MDKTLRYGAYAGVFFAVFCLLYTVKNFFSLRFGLFEILWLVGWFLVSLVFSRGFIVLGERRNSNLMVLSTYGGIVYNIFSFGYAIYLAATNSIEGERLIVFVLMVICGIFYIAQSIALIRIFQKGWNYGKIVGIIALLFGLLCLLSSVGVLLTPFMPKDSSDIITPEDLSSAFFLIIVGLFFLFIFLGMITVYLLSPVMSLLGAILLYKESKEAQPKRR